jgi:hypothetical protein
MPILPHVLLEATKKDELRVSATDLDISVSSDGVGTVARGRRPSAGGEAMRQGWRVRRGALSILVVGTAAAAMWILLWAFFLLGVVKPAARVHASGANEGTAAEAMSRVGARAIPPPGAGAHREGNGS